MSTPSLPEPTILKVHLTGAPSYEIGPEIWQQGLREAFRAEAELIAEHRTGDRLEQLGPDRLIDWLIAEMTAALEKIGDTYRAPDSVLYSLTDPNSRQSNSDSLDPMSVMAVVEEVLRFEELPIGSMASRRAVVRWSDGTVGEAIRWYSDEILFSEGDLIGKTHEQLRTLHFLRDRDSLQS